MIYNTGYGWCFLHNGYTSFLSEYYELDLFMDIIMESDLYE